jgi:hypothetical protein
MDDEIGHNKKAQVTIFIIVGIVIVIGVLFAVYFVRGIKVDSPSELGPKVFIDKCVQDVVEESVGKMLKNGGAINPSHAVSYHGDEYNYLCYNSNYYASCYNLYPMLKDRIEDEIYLDTKDSITECFNSMREDFELRGYDISGSETTYSIELLPGNIRVNLEKKFNVSKNGASQGFDNFNTGIPSSIYELVGITREILNTESVYCSFDASAYMYLYPKYNIEMTSYSNDKIYSVGNRLTEEKFRFAVRGCVPDPSLM